MRGDRGFDQGGGSRRGEGVGVQTYFEVMKEIEVPGMTPKFGGFHNLQDRVRQWTIVTKNA